jgi:nitrite reductase (NADH) small subunit
MSVHHHQLGSLAQIPPGEGRNFDIGSRRIAVFHARDGRAFATQAECPHRGGPLADGLLGNGSVVCPFHEWRFDLTTGETRNGSCPIAVYPLTLNADGTMTLELP